MIEQRYFVLMNGNVLADDMPLDMALVLVEAVFEKYHAQAMAEGMTISITAKAQEE